MLRNKDRPGASAIDVVMIPVLAEAGFSWKPAASFGLRLAAGGGFSLIFGRVNSALMNYAKPMLSTHIDAQWHASPEFSIEGGARLYYGFGFYAGQNMLYLAPELSANFHL